VRRVLQQVEQHLTDTGSVDLQWRQARCDLELQRDVTISEKVPGDPYGLYQKWYPPSSLALIPQFQVCVKWHPAPSGAPEPFVNERRLRYSHSQVSAEAKEGGVRVIAGKAKGHRLKSVPGKGTRPITDRAKSALFSIIGNDIIGCRFVDLFAGTGQVGIEALSRGAAEVVLVERAGLALRTIRENLAHTRLEEKACVVQADVFEFLAHGAEPFDYIYIAPPQYHGLWKRTLQALDENTGWLADGAWVIVQMHPREYEEVVLEHLALFDQRSYGSVTLCFYRHLPR